MSYQPKSYNKFLAGAATAAVVASAVVPVATHAAEKNLTDVKEGSYYAEAVNALAEAGVIKGYEDGTFRPNNQVTRAEVAKIIAVQLGLDTENAGSANYSDAKGHWANTGGYLAAVAKAGIMKGDGNGTFRPNAPLTRAEMASIVVRAYDLQAKEGFESQFKDLNAGGAWAADAIKTLEANGYANGIAKGQFGSASNVKRADVAVFLFRVAKGEAAPTVESVSAINNIEVNEGAETVNLPKEVEVKLSNGEKAQKAVEWDKKGLDLNKPGEYTLTGDVADTDLTASVKVVVKAVDPKVESVSAINAKEVEIKFNKAIDKATVLTSAGAVQNITFSPVGTDPAVSDLTGTLSADGKTLTVTGTGSFNGSYTVLVTDSVKTTDGKALDAFKQVVSLTDSVRPTVSAATYKSNNVATFTFSEPIDVADSTALETYLTLKDASGATYTPVVTLADDKKSFTLDLNGSSFVTGKDYTLTVAGLKDFAGNLISPNPVSLTVTKQVVDDVAPTVSSVTSSQAGHVVVTFSEKVTANANNVVARVGGVVADLDTNASLDATGTVLTVTDASFNGLKDITVSNFADAAGNAGTAKTVLVNFPVDSVVPTVTSSAVKTIDNKNYLVLTYSEDVNVANPTASITGTYVTPAGVEKNITAINTKSTTNVSSVTGTKNQVKVLIDSQEKGNYTVSLPAGLVTDAVGNASEVKSVSYTVAATSSETTKPTIVDSTPLTADLDGIVVQQADKNTVTIQFSEALATSSLNLNNFLVEGHPVAEKAVFTDSDQDTIKLTLKEGAIKTSGTYNFTVQNVADLAGNVMTSVTQPKAFTDNDVPGLTSAALTSNNTAANSNSAVITLTFDEAILDSSIVETPAVADFDVFVDGVKTAATVAEAMGASTNQVTLTLNRALTADEASKTITIKPATGFAVTDLAGNALPTFTSVTVSK
ncbi:S-layer homology domain-containing protein [Heyndrickxia oleronia]|uniref:S-layer homology domain-containing protein n=1 Tax=Heyndrickxia oleronia TaxID=38875 RepID=UPI00204061F0|nr:S-layer homology domain-containing protein [Heyndrickxia oleronia]MCM3452404.1 S-layer homology domain-containing protein [Heyndrickxia oleronia]